MREIKFRAWNTKQKHFESSISGYYIDFIGNVVSVGYDSDGDGHFDAYDEVHPEFVLMQSTGLLDKNGKEIYEGDILRITDTVRPVPNIYIHVVSDKLGWCTDGEGGYTGTSKDYAVFGWDLALPYEGHHEIIGNIYENPELLTC